MTPEKLEIWERFFSEGYNKPRYYFTNNGYNYIIGIVNSTLKIGDQVSDSFDNSRKLEPWEIVKLKLEGIIK